MADVAHPTKDFQTLTQPLIGLAVSLPWQGYGTAIFLELGELTPTVPGRRLRYALGEACIAVEWDWRIEAGNAVLYGSSSSRPTIASGIGPLKGKTIDSMSLVGQVPELVVRFSNGHCLRSMVMTAGDPQWSVRQPSGDYLRAKAGALFEGDGVASATEQEEAAFALAEQTAGRWGVPAAEPKRGACADCASFVYLDGEGHLLEYGVCQSAAGPFDGRVVKRGSGCPCFSSRG